MNDTVLVISGLDPTGGAGIAADIDTINTELKLADLETLQNKSNSVEKKS